MATSSVPVERLLTLALRTAATVKGGGCCGGSGGGIGAGEEGKGGGAAGEGELGCIFDRANAADPELALQVPQPGYGEANQVAHLFTAGRRMAAEGLDNRHKPLGGGNAVVVHSEEEQGGAAAALHRHDTWERSPHDNKK